MAETPVAVVIYNSKKLIPAPELSFAKSYKRTGDGSIIGTDHTVTMTGTIVACKGFDFTSTIELYGGSGYPTDDSDCCKFQNLLDMQEAIREHFKIGEDYHWFEVQNPPNLPKKWRARVSDINFAEGRWIDRVDYTITLDLQSEDADDNYIEFAESWNTQYAREHGGVYTLTHAISCSAKEFYHTIEAAIIDGWNQARVWLTDRLAGVEYNADGIKNEIIFDATGFTLSSYLAYEYEVSYSADEYTGQYSITELWILAKEPVYKEINVSVVQNEKSEINIGVSGSFKCLRTVDGQGFDAARTAFDAWVAGNGPATLAAQYYTGAKTLATCPSSAQSTYHITEFGSGTKTYENEITRTVEFSYDFSDSDEDTGKIITSITVDENNQGDCGVSVSIDGNVQGRACGGGDAFANAEALYADIDFDALAAAAYAGTLAKVSSSKTTNETEATIGFKAEYRNAATATYEHEQTVTVKESTEQSFVVVTVDGTITPFCTDGATSIVNGLDAWNAIVGTLEATAQEAAGNGCTVRVMNKTLGKTIKGVYTYSRDYNCGTTCFTDTLPGSENISVNHNKPADVIAKIPILGRIEGPIIQDKNTKTAEEYTINVDVKFEPLTPCDLTMPAGISGEIDAIINTMGLPESKYVESDVENWSPTSGQFSRTIKYTIENC